MANKWFRFYNSARHSRKVNGLSPICFRCWVLLLTIASEKNGAIPKDVADLAFELRMEPRRVDLAMKTLMDVGLIVDCGECYRTPDWDERQFRSDGSKERTRAWRERHAKRHGDATVTAQESESESESEKIEIHPSSIPAPPARKKARTQIGGYVPGEDACSQALAFWKEKGRTDIDLDEQIDQFTDHHLKTGSTMADWPAAWRTWYRNAVKFNKPEQRNGKRRTATSNAIEGAAMLYRQWQAEEPHGDPHASKPCLPAPNDGAKPVQARS